MNPVRYAALALAVLAIVAALLLARGCHSEPDVSAETPRPTAAETRHIDRAASAEADARALLDQANARAETIARLEADLATARTRDSAARAALAQARTQTDRIVITAPARVIRDTVRVRDTLGTPSADDGLPDLLAERIVVERLAADRALGACDARADTAEALAAVQAFRATWAYAAADSALSALSYTRLAYTEADRRASHATRLASRRGRLLTVAGGLLAGACAVAILR